MVQCANCDNHIELGFEWYKYERRASRMAAEFILPFMN